MHQNIARALVSTSHIGAVLISEREPDNREDPFPVATKTSDTIVGHVPRTVSCIFDTFLCHGGSIICTIIGNRRYSLDLPNGGVELPCIYAFTSEDKPRCLLQKARKRLEEEGKQVDNDVRIEKEVAVTNKPTATDSTTLGYSGNYNDLRI